jgi:Secretion system C-terminal sorting domain
MRRKKVKLSFCFLFFLGLTGLQAQEAITVTGGNASSSGGSVSYSLGQVVYTTSSGSNGTVSQGVQQPFEISTVTGTKETNITLQCVVYPNPTNDYIKLKIVNYKTGKLFYQLYDINGKLLENKKAEDNETNISMENLVSGTYLLKVTDNQKEVKTFRIIKK